jgi:two-component sensor histidine kinase
LSIDFVMNKIIITISFVVCISITALAQDVNLILQSPLTLKQKADSLLTLANKNKAMGKLEIMLLYLEATRSLLDELTDANTTLRYYVINAAYYDIKRNDQELIIQTKKALPFFEKGNLPNLKRSCLFFIAKGYRHQKLYDSAQKYFDLTEKLQNEYNPYLNWLVYSEKARMYQEADNVNLAESYFDKAYQITKAKGIRMDHGVMLSYLLGFYSYAKMPEKYANVMAEQIDFISKRKNPQQGESIHDVLYANLDKMPLEEKISFLTKVKNTLINQGDVTNAAFTNSTISALYEDNNQSHLSLQYMKENMELTKAPNQLLNHFIYAKATYRILSKAGMQQDANLLFDYLFKLKDSIGNKEQQAKLQELEIVYQTEKKQQEIVLLNSNNELKQKQIEVLQFRTQSDSLQMLRETEQRKALFKESLLKEFALQEQQKSNNLLVRQNILKDSIVESEQAYNSLLQSENNLKRSQLTKEQQLKEALSRENNLQTNQLVKKKQITWLLTGGIGLLIVSAFSIFTLYQKQKKKNIIIQKQADNLEILMKEIHHRVKNNMQIVSSLLDLQSISIKDQQASDAVKEGKNRVQSMALIHQNLYAEDNLKGIKAKLYINNLLQNLCDSYNISNDRVKIYSNIQDLNLDVDTMIPIGLIFNELLTNAFKYAFNEKVAGVLEIHLQEQNNQLQLSVKDDGPGFPMELDAKTTKSFGLRMIRAFAQKLKAVVEIKNDNGASIKINITKYAMA